MMVVEDQGPNCLIIYYRIDPKSYLAANNSFTVVQSWKFGEMDSNLEKETLRFVGDECIFGKERFILARDMIYTLSPEKKSRMLYLATHSGEE